MWGFFLPCQFYYYLCKILFLQNKKLQVKNKHKYYYSDGTQHRGPFTLEQLMEKGIDADTRVWYEGLPRWKKAREIDQVAAMLKNYTPIAEKDGIRKDDSEINNKGNPSISAKVWKSKGFRKSPGYIIFAFIITAALELAFMFDAMEESKSTRIFEVLLIITAIFFVISLLYVFIAGKEIYTLGIDYSLGYIWAKKSGSNRTRKEEWGSRVLEFKIVENTKEKYGAGSIRSVVNFYELHAKIVGSDIDYTVPDSFFYSERDAAKIINQVGKLL